LGIEVENDNDGGIVVGDDDENTGDDVVNGEQERVDDSSVGSNHEQAVEQPVVVPPFVLVARYLQSVVPKRMRLVSKLLISPRANAVWNGMVVLAGEVEDVTAAEAVVAPDTELVDGRLDPPD
jgi:hypothetical protein